MSREAIDERPLFEAGVDFCYESLETGALRRIVSFRFEVSYGKGPVTLELAAPIPPNADRDLRLLHDKLSTSYPSARVKLV